jgi:hypothetical protein
MKPITKERILKALHNGQLSVIAMPAPGYSAKDIPPSEMIEIIKNNIDKIGNPDYSIPQSEIAQILSNNLPP